MTRDQQHLVEGAGLNLEVSIENSHSSLIFRSESRGTCRFTFYRFTVRPDLLRAWNNVKDCGQIGVVETQQPFKQFLITLEGDLVFFHNCYYDPDRESSRGVDIDGDYYGIIEGYVMKQDFERLVSILVQHTP